MVHQLKKVVCFKDYNEVSLALAYFILNESLKTNEKFSIALSGGSTPQLLYKLLATPPFSNNINWNNILFFMVDERYVPFTNEESNFKMINEILFSKIKIPKKNIIAITTTTTAAQDALQYEKRIKAILKNKAIDIMLLGLGNDGHTASLFPGYALLDETKRIAKEEFIKEKNQFRISLILPFINKSKQIIFLVTGAEKSAIFKKITGKPNKKIPATLVQSKKPILWFVEEGVLL